MKKYTWITILFYITALYDGIFGLFFLIAPLSIFAWFEVTPPNHVGYVQFPAALLLVFALMFINIARHPLRNQNLIPYGILLKVSYCSVVFYYWFSASIPDMWKPFAIIDFFCGILFLWSYIFLAVEHKKMSQ